MTGVSQSSSSESSSSESSSSEPRALSPAESLEALRARFASSSRSEDPLAWAVSAYRLGFALSEQPSVAPEANLREALGLYEQATEVLTSERAPVEHARVLNAAGSAHRMLGNTDKAAQLFHTATSLTHGRGVAVEEASMLSNLGLVLTELGRLDEAIEAFERSAEILPDHTDEQRRTRVALQHNLAHAHSSQGTAAGLELAIATLEEAAALAGSIDAPMHLAMVWHSLGVARKAAAGMVTAGSRTERSMPESSDSAGLIADAIADFNRCLTIFTTVGFPFQHAIAKNNLGLALGTRPDLESLQRALASFEDALNIFDPRFHRPQWGEVYANAEALDVRLAELAPTATRADHTASLLGSMEEVERLAFLRVRLAQMERIPSPQRGERLVSFLFAVITQPPASYVATLRTTISVLMELPETMLQATVRAMLEAHALLEAGERRAADFILDESINFLLFGPQRIRVRDILIEIGWERP